MNRQKRRTLNRTGNQKCQICKNPNILVEHHINGRKIKNPNHSSNLCYICANCHNCIHYGIIVVEGWFKTTNGLELITHNAKGDTITGVVATSHLYVS